MTTRINLFNQYLTSKIDNLKGIKLLTTFIGTLGGSAATVNAGDTLTDGRSFTITDTEDNSVLPNLYVSGIPSVEIDASQSITADTSLWQGVTNETIYSDGNDQLTVGDSTDLNVNDNNDDDVYTYGGSNVTINNNPSSGSYGNYVEVHGGKSTASVTVNNGYDEENYIYDQGAGSIKTVSVSNETDYDTYIYDSGLSTLNLTGISYHYVYHYDGSQNSSQQLTVNLNNDGNQSGYNNDYWYFEDDNSQAIKFTSSKKSSKNFYLYAPSAKSLSFADSTGLSFFEGSSSGSDYLEAGNATLLTISGIGSFTADLSGLSNAAIVQASGSSGVVTVEMAIGGAQSFTGGRGQDVVTIGSDQTGVIKGGTSSNNEIILDDATAASQSDIQASTVKNFTTLGVSGSTSGTFDMEELSNYKNFDVESSGGNLDFENVKGGATLSIESSDNSSVIMAAKSNSSSTLNVGNSSTSGITLSDVEIDNVSTLNIQSNGTGTNVISTLAGNSLSTLNLSGTANLDLSGLPSTSLTINGTSDNSNITISSGDDSDQIALGSGKDSVTVGGAASNITYANHLAGNDTSEVGPNDSLSAFTLITGSELGDKLKIADTAAFDSTAVTASEISSAGQSTSTLSGWINGTFAVNGDDLAQHHAAWFQFGGDTYVVEQANTTGTAAGFGDTVVKLAGLVNLSSGTYNAGAAAIVL